MSFQVEAKTYEAAKRQVAGQVRDGWQVLSYRVDRDDRRMTPANTPILP